MIPATSTMPMISHSHHRLFPLSPPAGTTAPLDEVTALDAGGELLGTELADEELAELDALDDDGADDDAGGEELVTTGAVTWKLATPTVFDSAPMASSRCAPASRSAGTTKSTCATPVPSAVTGDSTIGAENNVRLTCSLALKPEKMTFCVPPATMDGDEMLCTIAALGAVGGA